MVFCFFICVLDRFKSVLLILLVLFILFKPYREAISLLKKDYAIRDVGKSSEKGISTIQRVKKECC